MGKQAKMTTSKRVALKSQLIPGVMLGLASGLSFASPVSAPVDSWAVQPDGNVITLQQKGNADQTWFETPEGYAVMQDGERKWVYAEVAGGNIRALSGGTSLVPSALVVGSDDPAAAGITPHLFDDIAHDHSDAYAAAGTLHRSVSGGNPISDVSGTIPTVVILGYYDDAVSPANCASCGTTTADTFQQSVFNTVNTGQSVANYYSTMSKGAVAISPVSETHGTANDGVVGWIRLGATTPEATASSTSSFKSNRVASDAITGAMSYMDFTTYDTDGNGVITNREVGILIVLAGYEGSFGRDESGAVLAGDTSTPRIWGQSRSFSPAFSGVSIPTQSSNGKTVSINTSNGGFTYSVIGERHGGHVATMGIMVHEMGHSVFNLPDLYDISSASYGIGIWSSMSYGSWGQKVGDSAPGDTPVALDAWSRVALGWVTPTTPTSGSTATFNSAAGSSGNVIKLPTSTNNEYFLVENRQKEGYDQGLTYLIYTSTYGGLAVWHIDDNVGSARLNNDNANASHKRVDIVGAVGDSKIDNKTNYGQATNLYYSGNVTVVNDLTTPSSRLYSGLLSGVEVSEVSISQPAMTAKVIHSGTSSDSNEADATARSAGSGGAGGGGSINPLWFLALTLLGAIRRKI